MAFSFVGCGSADTTSDTDSSSGDAASTDSISITVWCSENAVDLTTTQLANYNTENGTNIAFTVEPVGEGEAATNMVTDVTAGADVFCFAQDQLARLVQAGALTAVSSSIADTITAENDAGAVAAATVNDTIYAFPLTSDNGYFVYYDKSVITDESVLEDQTALIEACKTAGKNISFELTDSGWYDAAYFFATGCVSDWETDTDGNFTNYVDTFCSDNGVIAAKGIAELVNSGVFVNSSSAADFSSGSAVVVSGTWEYDTAAGALGDNLACAKLWSFTVDGTSYQLGSYSGNKLIGVKPQTDATKAAYCQSVAQYLTGEKCQQERFDALAWGPSNLNVQATEAVQQNLALAALAEQNAYATPQGQYPNAWWDVSKAIGASIQALGTASPSDSDLQSILDAYQEGINAIMNPSFVGWVAVGDLVGASWDTTGGEGAEDVAGSGKYVISDGSGLVGTWEADIEIDSIDGDAGFRVVLYNDWSAGSYDDTGIGFSYLTEGSVGTEGNDNNVVLDAGTYHIILEVTEDSASLTVSAA